MRRTIVLLFAAAVGALTSCQGGAAPTGSAPATTAEVAARPNSSMATPGGHEIRLELEGILCQGCVHSAEEALKRVEGVRDATVSFEDRTGTVRAEFGVTPELLTAALEKAEMNGRKMHFKATVLAP